MVNQVIIPLLQLLLLLWNNHLIYSLDGKLGDYSTAEEGARAMALEFIKPKVARKPGDGGFLVNVLRTGNCRFWKIEYDKVVSNENALKYIGAAQAQMKVNFEELFGN